MESSPGDSPVSDPVNGQRLRSEREKTCPCCLRGSSSQEDSSGNARNPAGRSSLSC